MTHVHVQDGQLVRAGTPVIDIGGLTVFSPVSGHIGQVEVRANDRIDRDSVVAAIDVVVRDDRLYVIALMYEPGMGLTLWARNDDAYDEFTSLVDAAEDLQLSPSLAARFDRLEELTHVGWERALFGDDDPPYEPADPAAASWRHLTDGELAELREIDVAELVGRAQAELGHGYSLLPCECVVAEGGAVTTVEYSVLPYLVVARERP